MIICRLVVGVPAYCAQDSELILRNTNFNNLLPPKGNDFNQLQIKLQEVMDECPHLLRTIDMRLHYDKEANRGLFVSI